MYGVDIPGVRGVPGPPYLRPRSAGAQSRSAAALEGAASPVSALNCSGRHVELDAFLDEPAVPVLELTGVKVPDGMPAGREPPPPHDSTSHRSAWSNEPGSTHR